MQKIKIKITKKCINKILLYLKYSNLSFLFQIHDSLKIPVQETVYLINVIRLAPSLSTTCSADLFFFAFYQHPALLMFNFECVCKYL